MLSILIPTYNYNVFPLVEEVYKQCLIENIVFEIIVKDDASTKLCAENTKINTLTNCSYTILEKNIGRSAIRNLLAKKASYNNLLFLDADVRVINNTFIKNYVSFFNEKPNYSVVYGGIVYQIQKPESNQLLRWVYGNKREALPAARRSENKYVTFLTLNFLIRRDIFDTIHFNEEIPNLRYEDLLFSYDLMCNQVDIQHIDNQVVHNGIETSDIFLKKTQESLIGLNFLLSNNYLPENYAKITAVRSLLKQTRLLFLVHIFYNTFKNSFEKNLKSSNPSIIIYDIYRLGYFSKL